MNNGVTIFFIIFFVILAAIITLVVVISTINKKYQKFVDDNSEALKNLKELNSQYTFYKIDNFDMFHAYDNEKFYDNISPQDYLTYELVYKQKKVSKALKDTLSNKTNFEEYTSKVNEASNYGHYQNDIGKLKMKKLLSTEEKMFKKAKLKPQIDFKIKVKLELTKINGSHREYKSKIFDAKNIKNIIAQLNQKRGDFYTNRDIWDAICRVERGKVTNKMRFAIYARDNNRCRICGRRTNDLEIDHIYPIAKGGKTTKDNLQTLCHRCNARKGDSV